MSDVAVLGAGPGGTLMQVVPRNVNWSAKGA